MGRLIYADAFSAFLKDAVIKHKYDRLNIDNTLTVADVLQSVCAELDGTGLEGFKNAPTVDAVPVVRCWDCRFWSKYPGSSAAPQYHECMARMTHIGNLYTTAGEYCSRGERKDGDHAEGTIQKERS